MISIVHRRTDIPAEPPLAFTAEFATHPSKVLQWNAFCNKSGLHPIEREFQAVTSMIAQFLGPVLETAREQTAFTMIWPAGGPWQEDQQLAARNLDPESA